LPIQQLSQGDYLVLDKKIGLGFMSKMSASHFYKINNFNKLKVFESHSAALLELYHTNVVVVAVVAVCCWYCLKLAQYITKFPNV
jgi:hypothetical protein